MDLPYAKPDGIPRSAQTFGRSSFLIPSRSMRWPPVSFTIGTAYFSATSAIRRSCSGVVTPPRICGTTEKVPSFWIVGVHPVVDEPCFAIVGRVGAPDQFEQ